MGLDSTTGASTENLGSEIISLFLILSINLFKIISP